MFKLESFVTPLLANYLNKYIKDLKADDLQLSLWKGEAVLNNLDLRLDAIEHDLGLPFTFVSGNIQELRIKVPWTRLTTEPVVISVNTMECVVQLTSPTRPDTPLDWEHFGSTKPKATSGAPTVAPPPGYMESLSTRVLNNVRIQFTNLILRYVEEDFILTVLVKNADYFTVNDRWEKSFVEVSQPDFCLRRVLTFHDLHISLAGKNTVDTKLSFPLVERTFVTCRFLTKFDGSDCRGILATVINILCDELHISVTDYQLPMVRRLIDMVIAFQAGVFNSRIKGALDNADLSGGGGDGHEFDIFTEQPDSEKPVAPLPAPSSSWTSWALSLIPAIPADSDGDAGAENLEDLKKTQPALPRASSFAAYVRKGTVTFAMNETLNIGRGGRSSRRPILRLEVEDGFLTTKAREAKFFSFRAAVGMCQLVAVNECPCGENTSSNTEAVRPILSFNDSNNSPSERQTLLSGSLFGTADDEKESIDLKAPFESMDSYLAYNSEAGLLSTFGVMVADSASVVEVPDDFTGNLVKMTESDMIQHNISQSAHFRVIISPAMLLLDSAAFHRYQHFMQWFTNYSYPPYDASTDPTRSPSPTLQNAQIKPKEEPLRILRISLLQPTLVVVAPSHPSVQRAIMKKKAKTNSIPSDSPALILQADRFDYGQTAPFNPGRLLDAAENISGLASESLKRSCSVHVNMSIASVEANLCILMPEHPPFRDVRHLTSPITVEYKNRQPVDRLRCQRLWGESPDASTIACSGIQVMASLPEILLTHFCVSGILQDIGSFVAHRTFKALADSVFDKSAHDKNLLRVDLKCGNFLSKLSQCSTTSSIVTRIASFEVSLLIGESSETLMSSVLKERSSAARNSSLERTSSATVGSMRISAYNVILRRTADHKINEVTYGLHLSTTTKLTVYSHFINRFIENLGMAVQYQRDFSNASLYREMTITPVPPQGVVPPVLAYPKATFEIRHEKVSLDVQDEAFDHVKMCIHSGSLRLISQHPNIASYEYDMRALLVNLGRASREACLGPVSGRLLFEAFGSGESVASFINGDISLLPLRVGATTLSSVKKVLDETLTTFTLLKNSLADQHRSEKPNKRVPPTLKVIASLDDLRMHHWEYHQISKTDRDSQIPDVNQVRFCESQTDQTMTWRYPELRTISSVAIIPVPFQISVDAADARQEIVCSLQYLKRPSNNFVDLRTFTLMESKECMFRFPDVIPEDFDRLPISDVWRVKVSYNIQEESLKEFPISVLSLAGCMKINSGIIVGVPSSLHFSFDIGVTTLGLIHHVPVLANSTGHSLISGFTYDSSYPSDQEFCRVKLDKISLHSRIVGDEDSWKISVDAGFWMECDFVNYRFLTVQPLLEACSFSCNFSYTTEDKVFIQAKLDSKTPLVLHCGQNAVHSLSMGYLAWRMAQTGEYASLPIMNHIVVCNDTCHVVRIRQYTTDECIYIKPKEMHPYSWRSQRAELKLQFSVETYPNLWSEACPVDVGSKLCTFPTAEDLELGLVCSVRSLNNIQKQVVLATQFMVSNQLNFDIEVQLYTEPDYVSNPVIEMVQEAISFPAGMASSTRCVPVEKIKRYRVRRKAGVWSEGVAMTAKSDHAVIKLPVVSGAALDVWANLTFPVAPPGSRLLAFSSVMCVKNHLPYAIHMEVDCGSAQLQENISAHQSVPFSLLPFSPEDCQVRINKIGSGKGAQHLKINLPQILAALPPRAFVRNSADLIGDTNLTAPLFEKGRRQSIVDSTNAAAISTLDFLLEFERQTAFTDTLLVHVKPNGIRLVSDYACDLLLYGEEETLITVIPRKGASVLPISSKGQVRLGVREGETVFLSDYFDIQPSQAAREPMMDCTGMGVLLSGGFYVVTFWEKDLTQIRIHHLTLRLTDEDSVYTLHITSRYSALYASDVAGHILLGSFVTPKMHTKMDYPAALKQLEHPSLSDTSSRVSLSPFVLLVPPKHPVELDPTRAADLLTYISISSRSFPEPKWSFPREIKDVRGKKTRVVKLNAPLPDPDDRIPGLCCKVTAVEDLGVCQLLVELSDAPNLIFRNNCPYQLVFGECVRKGPGFVTFEEKESFIPLPVVEPGSLATYSYPSRDEEFPRVSTVAPSYLLRIGRLIQTGSTTQQVVWSSTAVDAFTATNDRFVSVPGMCYLKLHFERQDRRTVRILIDPLSRVATPLQTPSSIRRDSSFPLFDDLSGGVDGVVSTSSSPAEVAPHHLPAPPTALNVGISCVLKSVIFTLDDEISNANVVAEVLRLSVDDISMQFYCDGQTTRTYECAVNVNDLQLDNQMYSCGFFDFPVIIAKENPTKNVQSILNVLCKLNSETLAPENIHVSVAPLACFVEDTLAFHLLRLVDTFLVPALLVIKTPTDSTATPTAIDDRDRARRLLQTAIPVIIERIHIAPVEVYLSLHAALKMFVGLNQTPLSFSPIDCNDVNSTTTEVWNFVMQHYIRGTLLRAGWVIGSMDLLGNPASLLRSLSAGCGDLFVQPFNSLHAGPVSFLQGLAKGASSCVSGISAGTLTSVTNLAESVSRNLDWVSLDDEHVMRKMEVKYRQHPDGLGSGLKQGLTGFGMSLLGAVAGLIDQPMQAVLKPSLTPAQYLTALMLGITKGVVGAVSKPVAGAAGLVSQTGQGILRGHGMLNFPPRRCTALSKFSSGFGESTLKYIWKVAPLLPNTVRTLCVVEAAPVLKDIDSIITDAVCLFLTDGALFVISSADDEFRQAYSLSKLDIRVTKPLASAAVSSHFHAEDLLQVTLLIESDSFNQADQVTTVLEETASPWDNETVVDVPKSVVISPSHSWDVLDGAGSRRTHFIKESFLLEWKDAKLFQELFLVAKSDA
ncbi:Vacuolar protein sorting-associated protein 13B [Hypsibius exemplaris]|uniref:Vacuolar protein sorting-associated protein 13B n=1 Tax=Hypsibius exemplaris TaxID=2072580 RepID=A0A1W0XCP1_HYPEX|nr:Vacuolar protein sorting-associated protein 13B [Hypsibius exemplaris]